MKYALAQELHLVDNSGNCGVNSRIEKYLHARQALSEAIQSDVRMEIQLADQRIVESIEELIGFDSADKCEMKILFRFLSEAFLVSEDTSSELRRRICNKFINNL